MSDLISRQAAIEALCKRCDLVQDDNAPCMGKCNDIKILEKLPSAQPERETGEWILTDFPDEQTYKCSSCNEHWTFLEGTPYDNGAYFCPNCGADMRQREVTE